LVAVADQGSFRGAARSLGYTQSAISHQIALLERGLDAPMFIRPGGRGAITLTPAGDAVYRRARRVLGEVETLGADVAAIQSGERQTLRIGVFQTATTELLPGALRTLREQRPDVEVVLSEIDDNARTFDQMAAGRLELAFLVNPEPDDRIQSIPLLDDPWVILTRRDSELAAAEVASFDLLDGVDVVAWNRRWRTQVELEKAWRRRAISPRVVYRTDVLHRGSNLTGAARSRFSLLADYQARGTTWRGKMSWPKDSPHRWAKLIPQCSVRERDLFGFPRPGDDYWNDQTRRDVAARYPGIDTTPYE